MILVVLAAVAAAAAASASATEGVRGWAAQGWDSLPEKDLVKVASIVTIFSLVVTPLFYFARRWHESRAERRRASQNLYLELADARDGLDTTKSADLKQVHLDSGEVVYFMNRMFNHDFYDSLVFSGRINFVKPELQQRVQHVFHYIKDHNYHLLKVRELEDVRGSGGSADVARHYRMLGGIDGLLRDSIPELMAEFRSEYGAHDGPRASEP